MSTDRRRQRGTQSRSHTLYASINPEGNAWLDQTSLRLGVSKAELVDEIILHVRAASDMGIPKWWDRPIPEVDEELPMTG